MKVILHIRGDYVIQAVFTIGIVLTVITVLLAIILPRMSFEGIYTMYIPFFALFIIGLLLLLFATVLEKKVIMGAGLGGWGIACVFSSAIGFVVGSIIDAYKNEAA